MGKEKAHLKNLKRLTLKFEEMKEKDLDRKIAITKGIWELMIKYDLTRLVEEYSPISWIKENKVEVLNHFCEFSEQNFDECMRTKDEQQIEQYNKFMTVLNKLIEEKEKEYKQMDASGKEGILGGVLKKIIDILKKIEDLCLSVIGLKKEIKEKNQEDDRDKINNISKETKEQSKEKLK